MLGITPGNRMQPRAAMIEKLESTASLLAMVKGGDEAARERLCALYLPMLMRWAHGRLPPQARGLAETCDLVQATLIQALAQLGRFESRHEGAFLAYLRTALLNNLRNEIRRGTRHPSAGGDVDADFSDRSSLAEFAGRDALLDYEKALATLAPEQREAVILRVEFGFSYAETAAALDKPSADAARVFVARALEKLAGALA
jgi:RNA polymerase sigma-70 factor (ECF subfamily)